MLPITLGLPNKIQHALFNLNFRSKQQILFSINISHTMFRFSFAKSSTLHYSRGLFLILIFFPTEEALISRIPGVWFSLSDTLYFTLLICKTDFLSIRWKTLGVEAFSFQCFGTLPIERMNL